jgi:hypothetical protein
MSMPGLLSRVCIALTATQSHFTTGDLPPIGSSCRQNLLGTPGKQFSQLNLSGYSPYVSSSLTRGCVCRLQLFYDPRQRSQSRIRVHWDSWPYFTASNSRPSQRRGPDPLIYIPQEENHPVVLGWWPRYVYSAWTAWKTPHTTIHSVVECIRCSGNVFTQTFPRNGPCNHVTILIPVYRTTVLNNSEHECIYLYYNNKKLKFSRISASRCNWSN